MCKKILFFLLMPFLLGSCLKEKTEDCSDGFRLQFKYTYNNEYRDQLTDHIRDIRIYVFDAESEILREIVRADREDIARGYVDIVLPDGAYTFVAWGSSGEDVLQGSYGEISMSGSNSVTDASPIEIGQTHLRDFRMMLNCDTYTGDGEGEITPSIVHFDDLFHACAYDIDVVSRTRKIVVLDFMQNTSILKILVTGLEYLSVGDSRCSRSVYSESPLGIFVTGYNHIYRYGNNLETDTPLVHYEPPYTTLTDTTMEIDIKIQRMELGWHTLRPLMLYVYSPSEGHSMIYPLNVIEAILSIKDSDGTYRYGTQEDIDRENEFPIEISILHDLSVKVVVAGFELVDITPEISNN